MPFTGSHPAAVLPLLRTGLPASALVAGSLAPDLPFYLPGRPGWPTHGLLGIVTVDVVLGAAAWALWHGLLAAPARAAAPAGLRRRAPQAAGLRARLPSVRAVAGVLAGVAVGAATHVGWDEFTHEGRWGEEHVPVLAARWGTWLGYEWTGSDVAQHVSSLVGAAVLAGWLARWWRRTPSRPDDLSGTAWAVWGGLLALGAAAGLTAALRAPGPLQAGFDGATAGGAAMAAAAGLAAAVWHARHRAPTDG